MARKPIRAAYEVVSVLAFVTSPVWMVLTFPYVVCLPEWLTHILVVLAVLALFVNAVHSMAYRDPVRPARNKPPKEVP